MENASFMGTAEKRTSFAGSPRHRVKDLVSHASARVSNRATSWRFCARLYERNNFECWDESFRARCDLSVRAFRMSLLFLFHGT